MPTSSHFASVAIKPARSFSWVFFADWLLAFSIVICIIFYFSRFLGLAITTLLRWTIWRSKKVKVDVQSVKFSFLAGRLFFKNLTIIDKDKTISALSGSLTWRYWLPNVRKRDIDLTPDEEGDFNTDSNSKLPSRFLLECDGLEVFIYNRTVSYETILQNIAGEFPNGSSDDTKEFYDVFSQSASESTINNDAVTPIPVDAPYNDSAPSIMTKIFPIQIKVNKGAIVAGNRTTQAVLILSYEKLNGNIDMKRSANPLDRGCQSNEFSLQNVEISMKPNVLYDVNQRNPPGRSGRAGRSSGRRHRLFGELVKLWNLVTPNHIAKEKKEIWRGLAQYLDVDNGPSADILPEEEEYAKYTGILSARLCEINYCYDFPGLVRHHAFPAPMLTGIDIGNGGPAPYFGINVSLTSATIHYGPWAERQRHTLYQMLLPTTCRDAVAQRRLHEGQRRIFTQFTMNIEIKDECILRIPTREPSKDEEHRHSQDITSNSIRPFAWIELKVAGGSRICSINSQIASNSGYENRLEASLLNLEVRSSVNHDIFLRSARHVISADVGYPLGWNTHTVWSFLNESHRIETFLLREHITLLGDLFTDFGSGTPTPYELFRPFSYNLNWNINDYKLYFNINDANIVNNPLDFNDNIYLSLQGEQLRSQVHIPLDAIAKKTTTIDYAIETPGFSLILDTPPWHTLNNFLKSKELGRSKEFSVDGSYTYYPELGLDNVETIIIACKGDNVVLMCYGFIVKYIMSIRENYFGDFTRFKTLEEYTSSLNDNKGDEEPSVAENEKQNFKRIENEIDVHFSFCVDDSCIILPANLYDAHSNISLVFEDLDIDIRFTNYYMDMQVDMTPATGYFFHSCDSEALLDLSTFQFPDNHHLVIDGLNIHGHRIFGLPPDEPTCFCKWDIVPGEVNFTGSAKGLEALVSSLIKLGFGYKNLENELLLDTPTLFDTTGLNIVLPLISINLHESNINETASLELKSVVLKFIDYTNSRYTKKISVDINEISGFVRNLATDKESLNFVTSLRFTDFCLDPEYEEVKMKKEDHIIKHDGPFHRIPFLLDERIRAGYNKSFGKIIPSFSLPNGNPALISENLDAIFANIGIEIGQEDSSIFEEDNSYSFIQDFDRDSPDGMTKKSHWDTIAGVHVNAISFYDDDDFTPLLKADPTFETNNFILNVGDIDGTVSMESLFTILEFCRSYSDRNTLSTLDDLHLAVLKRLNKRLNLKPTCDNLRFVAPILSLRFCENAWDLNKDSGIAFDHIATTVTNPSVAFSTSKDSNGVKETVLAVHFETIDAKLVKGDSAAVGLNIVLEDFEWWSNVSNKQVCSALLKSTEVLLDPRILEWVIHYVTKLRLIACDFVIKLETFIVNTKLSTAEIVYQIAMGSVNYKIEHDPAVITRPAYIIRVSKKHIRANDSWKVITRLRHIFECLPEDLLNNLEARKAGAEFKPPPTAMKDVINVFTQWRSWEFTDIANSFVFKYVFESKLGKPFIASISDIKVESFTVKTKNSRGNSTVIDLKGVNFSSSSDVNEEDLIPSRILTSSSVRIESLKAVLEPLTYGPASVYGSGLSKPQAIMEGAGMLLKEHQVVVSFGSVNVEVVLTETKFVVKGKDSMSSFLVMNKLEGHDAVINTKLSQFQLSGYYRSHEVFHHVTSQFKSFIFAARTETQNVAVNSSSELSTFGTIKSTTILASFVESFGLDVLSLSKLAGNFKLPHEDKKGSSFKWADLTASFRYKNKVLKWNIPSIDTLGIKGTSDMFEVSVKLSRGTILSEFLLSSGKARVDLSGNRFTLVESLQNGLALSSNYKIQEKELELDWNFGSSSMLVSDVFANYDLISKAAGACTHSFAIIQKSFETVKKEFTKDMLSPAEAENGPFFFSIRNLKLSMKYLAAGIKSKSTLFSLSFNHILIECFDIITDGVFTKPYGELVVESTQLNISDKRVKANLSNILDFSFGMSLLKPSGQGDQTLELKSSYSRSVLSSSTVVKLIQLKNDVSYLMWEIAHKGPLVEKKSDSFSFTKLLNLSSIHVLSYNLCVGFIFDEAIERSPGLIVGCEKLFAITEGSLGKLSLINSYFSLAKGKTSQDFFPVINEYDSPNRAFLPNMQVTYAISKSSSNKDIKVRVTGEELDVKFIASSIVFIEQFLKSIATIEHLKQTLPRYPKVELARASYQEPYVSLPPDVTSIDCEMNFAGGVIKIFRWEDFGDTYSPSLELRAPAVKILTSYSKAVGLKEHMVNFDLYTFSSNNILYASCVPVLVDIWDTVKQLGTHSVPRYEPKALTKDLENTMRTFDYMKVLSQFQLNFALHIDKQELILSCEPSAKVQAVVGIGSIDIRLMSNEGDGSNAVAGSIDIQDIGASLQHSFSRETSGSVRVNEMLFTGILADYKNMKFYCGAKCDRMTAYLNLKQMQDVNLFTDLWFPGSSIIGKSKENARSVATIVTKDEMLALKFQRVSGNKLIPWTLDIIIKTLECKVDLGKSLGMLSLDIDKIWAISRKKSDREQDVIIGFNSISFCSKGRLSGHLHILNIRLHSVIQWSMLGDTFEAPIVSVSFGFDSIQTKASFDYNAFMIGRILKSHITVYNQVDKNKMVHDALFAGLKCESVEVYITTFAAANILDVYNTLTRIRQDNKRSYRADLKTTIEDENSNKTQDIIDAIASLRTKLDVDLGHCLLHVYPGSFLDSQVLVIDVCGLDSHFEQQVSTKTQRLEDDLKLLLRDINVSLSSYRVQISEEELNMLTMDEFVQHSKLAKGGNIFIFPSLGCSMKSFTTSDPSVIEYIYKSSFGGKVDVRWNLGSIQFIREMWMIHKKALLARLRKDNPPSITSQVEDNYEDKIERSGPIYNYVPLEEPIIEAPQLRDLGNATPPLEWFGLYREKFPGLTHQFVITALQKLVHEVELEYVRVLGKA